MIMWKAVQRDPNWARLHHLVATLISVLEHSNWSGEGKPPLQPHERLPWLKTVMDRKQERDAERMGMTLGIATGAFDHRKAQGPGASAR